MWFHNGEGKRAWGYPNVECIYSESFNVNHCHLFTAEYVKAGDVGLCADCARELGLIW